MTEFVLCLCLSQLGQKAPSGQLWVPCCGAVSEAPEGHLQAVLIRVVDGLQEASSVNMGDTRVEVEPGSKSESY